MQERSVRIGIDVGGTFTDVVAVDAVSKGLIGSLKVPTTHSDPRGVAAGIIEGLRSALARFAIEPHEVAFIAHSTTQATNALLEGDLASVAVVGILSSGVAWLERRGLRFAPITLGPHATFAPSFAMLERMANSTMLLERLRAEGIEAVAASAPFGVDDTASEDAIVAEARALGMAATSGHEVATLYGLRARTRTAALNAAILPKMMQTSAMTALAVSEAQIPAPLMIMRSDGGVMDVAEVARRPILTMLSGPAAGIAGALLYESVTDGIFIEVGGTSADCSVIRHGQPQMRPARIGGHRTLLRTLDVRTIGVAGGSMARIASGVVRDVGPRSAHIANCEYACFADVERVRSAKVSTLRPLAHDPDDYVLLTAADGMRMTLTLTCAANMLGEVPPGAFSLGNVAAAQAAFSLVGAAFGLEPRAIAQAMLLHASRKLRATIDELVNDYQLDRRTLVLVGGGGGAGALVPFAAKAEGCDWRLARDAEVISPIGVALALVRDTVERTIVDPTPEDIVRIRREAIDAAVKAGAAPDRVAVSIDIDRRRNLVRASASGATTLAEATARKRVDRFAQREAAARALLLAAQSLEELAAAGGFALFRGVRVTRGPLGFPRHLMQVAIVDETGAVKGVYADATCRVFERQQLEAQLTALLEETTSFGDVGRALPDVIMLYGQRLVDLGGLATTEQVAALAQEELSGTADTVSVALLAASKPA